jgi:hypothetical protein
MEDREKYILGLDVSTKTIGIALFEDKGDSGELKLLHHVSPKIKPKPKTKIGELCDKATIFEEEFLSKYSHFNITRVIIEEPLLRSNNVNTVATLLRFNGIVSRSVYQTMGIEPEYISSYDSRKYAFPDLMQIRKENKKGELYNEKHLARSKPVLFGGLPYDIDKKTVVFERVALLEPDIGWMWNKKNMLAKENYDMTDAYACVLAVMQRDELWKVR